jgi:parallel beta-helix repeat protein
MLPLAYFKEVAMRKVAFGVVLTLLSLGVSGMARASAARTIIVRPGESIQTAIDHASPGDRILVLPGTYTEAGRPCPTNPLDTCAIVITADDITLTGLPRHGHPIVLQALAGQAQGIAIAKAGDSSCLTDPSKRIQGATLGGFTVQGFEDTGVFLFCVDDWRITETAAIANAEYGFFPASSGAGRIDHSSASGANDTGIYVGQSHDVIVDHNTSTGNVAGFEIENSSNVLVSHNEASGNTAGILSFTLPFLDVKTNTDNRIDHNFVHDNNKANTCQPGDLVCLVPVGSGIGLVAADGNSVDHNDVTRNDTFGIVVANLCNAFQFTPEECAGLDVDPNTDDARVVYNTALSNGENPDPNFPFPSADLLWDGTGSNDCWGHNVFGTSFPAALPPCG